ncbi:hypothetical protein D2L64_17700 [Micromonospora radicis]|uniref:Uncharacterized protein n=2 Tax=Micromonospora radicis TaxID=1894971 RepID=A0A418MSS8_9ACTN|nr:hypothetical protein D2L64_17700 [Micromonospora radicis]
MDLAATTVVPHEDPNWQSQLQQSAESPASQVLFVPIIKHNTSPAHQIDPAALDAAFGAAMFLKPCQQEAAASGETGMTDQIRMAVTLYGWWLTTKNMPLDGSNYPGELDVRSVTAGDPVTAAALDHFSSLSTTDQAMWIKMNQDRVSKCRALPPA